MIQLQLDSKFANYFRAKSQAFAITRSVVSFIEKLLGAEFAQMTNQVFSREYFDFFLRFPIHDSFDTECETRQAGPPSYDEVFPIRISGLLKGHNNHSRPNQNEYRHQSKGKRKQNFPDKKQNKKPWEKKKYNKKGKKKGGKNKKPSLFPPIPKKDSYSESQKN